MRTEPPIDIYMLLPAKCNMVRVAAVIVLLSLICGLLLGLLVFNAPRSALALVLGNAFVVGGSAVFSAPGGALLALEAGLAWGLGIAMLATFVYVAWLIHHMNRDYKRRLMAQRMQAFGRAIEGRPPE